MTSSAKHVAATSCGANRDLPGHGLWTPVKVSCYIWLAAHPWCRLSTGTSVDQTCSSTAPSRLTAPKRRHCYFWAAHTSSAGANALHTLSFCHLVHAVFQCCYNMLPQWSTVKADMTEPVKQVLKKRKEWDEMPRKTSSNQSKELKAQNITRYTRERKCNIGRFERSNWYFTDWNEVMKQ